MGFLKSEGNSFICWASERHNHQLPEKFKVEKKWTPHDLRHSFAHNYLKKDGNMYALQALLGHKSITMTVNYYGQIQASDVEMVSPYD